MAFLNELLRNVGGAFLIGGGFAAVFSIVALMAGVDLLRGILCTVGFGALSFLGGCVVDVAERR